MEDAILKAFVEAGAVGIIGFVLIWIVRKYDSLGERMGVRIDKINERRVKEAMRASELAQNMMEIVLSILSKVEKTSRRNKEVVHLAEALMKEVMAYQEHDLDMDEENGDDGSVETDDGDLEEEDESI